MPIIATFRLKGISPYSQSRPHLDEMEPNESHDDYRKRTWRSHLHVDKEGKVIIRRAQSRTAFQRRRNS
jgi:hypothetical protein